MLWLQGRDGATSTPNLNAGFFTNAASRPSTAVTAAPSGAAAETLGEQAVPSLSSTSVTELQRTMEAAYPPADLAAQHVQRVPVPVSGRSLLELTTEVTHEEEEVDEKQQALSALPASKSAPQTGTIEVSPSPPPQPSPPNRGHKSIAATFSGSVSLFRHVPVPRVLSGRQQPAVDTPVPLVTSRAIGRKPSPQSNALTVKKTIRRLVFDVRQQSSTQQASSTMQPTRARAAEQHVVPQQSTSTTDAAGANAVSRRSLTASTFMATCWCCVLPLAMR